MKNAKPALIWVILGVVALVVWLAWPSGKELSRRQPVTALPSPSPSLAPSVGSALPVDHPLVATPSTPSARPGTTQSSGPASAAGGTAVSPANGAPVVPSLNPGDPGAPNQAAQIDAVRVRHMISDYHTLMNENPVGTNAEIMKQMTGGNSRQATLGPPDGIPLNAQGELVDQWGTPYFFHQLSRDKMEIRSAGPDKVMWTADDVIAR